MAAILAKLKLLPEPRPPYAPRYCTSPRGGVKIGTSFSGNVTRATPSVIFDDLRVHHVRMTGNMLSRVIFYFERAGRRSHDLNAMDMVDLPRRRDPYLLPRRVPRRVPHLQEEL